MSQATAVSDHDALEDVLEAMEAVDWAAAPTVSTAEAAAIQARLVEARESLEKAG